LCQHFLQSGDFHDIKVNLLNVNSLYRSGRWNFLEANIDPLDPKLEKSGHDSFKKRNLNSPNRLVKKVNDITNLLSSETSVNDFYFLGNENRKSFHLHSFP
jgi:hypothetical protein